MKQLSKGQDSEIRVSADACLADIATAQAGIDALKAEAKAAMQALEAEYGARLTPLVVDLKGSVAWLTAAMKGNKKTLFDGTDVVRLTNGSLIRLLADKVKIPNDALARCEEQGFYDVIKIAHSLDRDAVKQWPDERLILIGAERKQKEEFSYDLKEVKS